MGAISSHRSSGPRLMQARSAHRLGNPAERLAAENIHALDKAPGASSHPNVARSYQERQQRNINFPRRLLHPRRRLGGCEPHAISNPRATSNRRLAPFVVTALEEQEIEMYSHILTFAILALCSSRLFVSSHRTSLVKSC